MNLSDILLELRRWLETIRIPSQILTDTDRGLRVIFETENALAELIAGEGECAPYRFVSFTVLDLRLDLRAEPVFCFHDNDTHTAEDILRELARGIRYLM